MGISSKPKRRIIVQEVEDVDEVVSQPQPTKRRKRRFVFLFLLFVLMVWFLPVLLAKTPLLTWVVNRFGNLRGEVSVQTASLGWFSPPTLNGIEVRDEQNQPLLEIPSVTGSRSLLSLAISPSNLGSFRLDKPKLTLRLRADGSNLEDVIASYLSSESSSKKIGVGVEITDATVTVIDEVGKRTWKLDEFSLALKTPSTDAEPLTLQTSGRFNDSKKPGKLEANVTWFASEPSSKSTSTSSENRTSEVRKGKNELSLKTTVFPLDLLQPVLQRFSPQTQLSGWLNSEIRTEPEGEASAGKTAVRATVSTEDFCFASPVLGQDQVRLNQIRVDGKGTWTDELLTLESTSLLCDFGEAQLSGTLPRKGLFGESRLPSSELLKQPYQVTGRIDLARLAALFPNLLHIRKQTEIRSGEIQVGFASRPQKESPQNASHVWQGYLRAANLTANNNGTPVSWPQPISLDFTVHEAAQGLVVDTLQCNSDFLKISANGSTENLTASASFNLKPLAEQLGQFVELGNCQLLGEGWANINWKRDTQQIFETDSEIQLQNFQLVLPGQQPWQEPQLTLSFSAKGKTDFSLKNTELQSAVGGLKAGNDQAVVQLQKPVNSLAEGGVWPLHLTAQGQVAHWFRRVGAVCSLPNYQTTGTANLDVKLTASTTSIDIASASLHAEQLTVNSPTIHLNEPQVDLTAAGSWNAKQRQFRSNSILLRSYTIAAETKNLVVSIPENGPVELAGSIEYQTDLERLLQSFRDPQQAPAWKMSGVLAGGLLFRTQEKGVIYGETGNQIQNLTLADTTGRQFFEPSITLGAVGEYNNTTGILALSKAELSSTFLSASMLGKTSMKEPARADLDAKFSYNLDRITAMLRPVFADKIRLSGQAKEQVAWWRGPLSFEQGRAAAEAKWDWATVYGFEMGPAVFRPKLEGGVLSLEPMQVDLSGGKLFLAPKLRLAPTPRELIMPPGTLVQNAQITPDMCEFFLKYIAPVLAEVTEARGAFSIHLTRCRLPIDRWTSGELAGNFIVHNVEIGPGPLIREFAVLTGRAMPAKLRRESVVPFHMSQGRIIHDQLELLFPDFMIRTRGSVGIEDQTLDLLAEMPIPPKWLENNPAAVALRNQTLSLPVGGTLTKPKLNQAKLDEYTRQFFEKAAGNLIEEGVYRGIDQLLRKKNPQ